jgi:hypothetical protein
MVPRERTVDLERERVVVESSSSKEFGGPPGVDNSILMAGGGWRQGVIEIQCVSKRCK